MWPAIMVQRLNAVLPSEFTAEPRVHLGSYYEVDVCAYEENEPTTDWSAQQRDYGGGATATAAPPAPTFTVDADLVEQYAYEVLIFDQSRARQLVAAVEIVTPANKDRPENRR